ncbi:MAG: glutamine--fructose-6-phosphate transaminase (isomerizing) [Bacteroidales bacterium]|jgi:glucosamine--fructose-6-phosphate aminotransferase (isomerizing)|nr:glutamine--fructose-6-phosphate transaminase (isomerizing) [Bacteroidales bacterium]NCU36447.1 glutamine--fructose-6-phosphate transaminase (isomerizing) [Candidatus Falkowbacteria bacterium]MDD2632727.1 glutamine--fructose-6-phosphate transaminase (isomerizing) [Bacteroidales bacterium]MDD3131834.1 glutamine--fructose-6-phosphate transaminase (isomerizing) [Bacteroidales bacterium]MDD3527076.1 glutamine--fructose-6-phosphate transaminase (isomerizing) [Bacteroidales bacterium]
MCGIVGYVGKKEAYPILINGLKRLEYRGYDSAGIALLNGNINLYKTKGKVSELEDFVKQKNINGQIGIAHTRWATHGEPNNENAHPHFSESEELAIIHNGIIENYDVLKEELQKAGYHFRSNTDTEVLIQLIEYICKEEKVELVTAIQLALSQVIGAYAIVVISKNHPDQLIAARKGSPLVVGIGKDEFYLASDASPIVEFTRDVVYVEEEEIAIMKLGEKLHIKTIKNQEKTPFVQQLEMDLTALEKGGYKHFMLKEIFEQPKSIRDSIRGRVNVDMDTISMAGMIDFQERFLQAGRIIFLAAGTSWHASLVGEYLFEELARIPVEVEYASEFRYRNPIINKTDVVIAVSQSGETADTLAAIRLAKQSGAFIYSICNVVGSSIAREADAGSYTHAGPEIGVASTKAFTSQVTVLALMALYLGRRKGLISESRFTELLIELNKIPQKVEETLKLSAQVEEVSKIFTYARNFLYLGRGYNFPVALEGALKLKEISYIHAEGYPAAEMKHGPIALIDKKMPVVVITPTSSIYDKVVSNIQEIKARKGKVIAVVSKGDKTVSKLADYTFEIPETDEIFSPLLAVIPLQLLSYYIADMRDCEIDQPRNLAKSVTVE